MNDWIAVGLLVLGAAFLLLAGIGMVRFPDLYMRMSAASKGASLGAGLVLAAVAFHFARADVSARALAAAVFVFLTVPVAAHMVARAGYLSGVHISPRTQRDELQGRYDLRNVTLSGRTTPPPQDAAGPAWRAAADPSTAQVLEPGEEGSGTQGRLQPRERGDDSLDRPSRPMGRGGGRPEGASRGKDRGGDSGRGGEGAAAPGRGRGGTP